MSSGARCTKPGWGWAAGSPFPSQCACVKQETPFSCFPLLIWFLFSCFWGPLFQTVWYRRGDDKCPFRACSVWTHGLVTGPVWQVWAAQGSRWMNKCSPEQPDPPRTFLFGVTPRAPHPRAVCIYQPGHWKGFHPSPHKSASDKQRK